MDGCSSHAVNFNSKNHRKSLNIVFMDFPIKSSQTMDPHTSAEFAEFLSKNGITHVKSAPYHPSTNGLAESHPNKESKELLMIQFKINFPNFSSLTASLHTLSLKMLPLNFWWEVTWGPYWTLGIISEKVRRGWNTLMILVFHNKKFQLEIMCTPKTLPTHLWKGLQVL